MTEIASTETESSNSLPSNQLPSNQLSSNLLPSNSLSRNSLSGKSPVANIYGAAEFAKLLEAPVSIEDILSQLTPPKHFANATFENYRPAVQFPSQRVAMERVLAWVNLHDRDRGLIASIGRRFSKEKDVGPRGVYLDGGFGVGKTHLLAAAYHAFIGKKAYLSFQELMFLVGLQTLPMTVETFSNYEILFLDEFELDDPANTRIASNLVGKLIDKNVRIITTSNTPPGALGEDKFSVSDFARELQEIATRINVIRIDGEDYRVSHENAMPETSTRIKKEFEIEFDATLSLRFSELLLILSSAHPIRVRNALSTFSAIELKEVIPIDSPNEALRFVYFIDKSYDYDLALKMESAIPSNEIFSSSVLRGGDSKKYLRTISRLQEMTRNFPFRSFQGTAEPNATQ